MNSFWDKVVTGIFQLVFLAGIIYFMDKLWKCCRGGGGGHPIPGPSSYGPPVTRSPFGVGIPVPNPM